jgi:hypothetical protein
MRISDQNLESLLSRYHEDVVPETRCSKIVYDICCDLRDLRELAAVAVHCRAKLIRAKEEESLRSQPSVRRVDDARTELAYAIFALKTHLEDIQ